MDSELVKTAQLQQDSKALSHFTLFHLILHILGCGYGVPILPQVRVSAFQPLKPSLKSEGGQLQTSNVIRDEKCLPFSAFLLHCVNKQRKIISGLVTTKLLETAFLNLNENLP